MHLAAILVAAVVSGAPPDRPSPPAPIRAELDKPFELKPGQSALVSAIGLRVAFQAVSEDSRCPTGVQCIWEGDAAVEVTLEKPPAAKTTRALHTSGRYPRDTEYEGLRVRLKAVTPSPKDGLATDPRDYRATLVVEKR